MKGNCDRIMKEYKPKGIGERTNTKIMYIQIRNV